jgi:hypothetical protein
MLVSGIVVSTMMAGTLLALFVGGAVLVALDKRFEAGRHE